MEKDAQRPLLSVIVPVYRAEQYLHKCLDSLVGQTYRNLEIILVEDGSPDSCGAICDAYAARDERIRVIHQENRGASAARNAGIRATEGEYVLFLDADDIYAENAIDSGLLAECGKGYDVILCSSLNANADRDRYGIDMKVRDGEFAGRRACPITGHFASCLYKRKLLLDNHIWFDEEICLNEQELSLIQHKMRQLGTHNFGAYARKMLIDGYIIKVDYTEQKKLAAAVSRIAANINQICRRINSTGRCYEDDVAELKARQAEIWELLKIRQKDEL